MQGAGVSGVLFLAFFVFMTIGSGLWIIVERRFKASIRSQHSSLVPVMENLENLKQMRESFENAEIERLTRLETAVKRTEATVMMLVDNLESSATSGQQPSQQQPAQQLPACTPPTQAQIQNCPLLEDLKPDAASTSTVTALKLDLQGRAAQLRYIKGARSDVEGPAAPYETKLEQCTNVTGSCTHGELIELKKQVRIA